MRELDYVALAETLAQETPEALESVGAALGVTFTAASMKPLAEHAAQGNYSGTVGVPKLLALIFKVMRSKEGIVYERITTRDWKIHCLLVRFTDGGKDLLTIGVDRTLQQGIGSAWNELLPWSRKLADNRVRAEPWARGKGWARMTLAARTVEHGPTGIERDELGLRQAVIDNPDDDAPRLIFADWLEEHGSARAELIRLQCKAAIDPTPLHEAKIKAILQASWTNFAADIAPYTSETGFQRGFVHRVKMTIPAFVKHGERIFKREPVQVLTVANTKFTEKDLVRLAEAPATKLVRELRIQQTNPTAARLPLAALASGQSFERLKVLHLNFCGKSSQDWLAFFERLHAPRLEEVHFHYNHSSSAIYLGLARNPSLSRLRLVDEYVFTQFDKSEDRMTAALSELAARRPTFECLRISQNEEVSDEAIGQFYAPANAVSLQELDLTGAHLVTDRTGHAIAASPRANALRRFNTHNSHIKPAGLRALLHSPHVSALEELKIVSYDAGVWTKDDWNAYAQLLIDLPASHPLKRVELRGGELDLTIAAKLKTRFS